MHEKTKMRHRRLWCISFIAYLCFCLFVACGQYFGRQAELFYRPSVIVFLTFAGFAGAAIFIGRLVWYLCVYSTACKVLYCLACVFTAGILCLTLAFRLPTEQKMDCGYLELRQGHFLDETEYSYAEPRYGLFMQYFVWDVPHEIHILESQYATEFTEAPSEGDGVRRYIPSAHPNIAVEIANYDVTGTIDDYQYQLTASYIFRYYRAHKLCWDYEEGRHYRGDTIFVLHKTDDLQAFAKDIAGMIAEAVQDPFYDTQVGWISVKSDTEYAVEKGIYFGNYIPFLEKSLPPDYYADWENVLPVLQEIASE